MDRLQNPRREGKTAGKIVARRHWAAFLFNGDPKDILLSKAQAEEFVYKRGLGDEIEFRDPGVEDWREATKREYNAWWEAFREAYKIEIERLINSFITKAIKTKMDIFCEMVGRIRGGISGGSETPEESYGVHLGKVDISMEKTIVLSRSEVPRIARKAAVQQARSDWERAIKDKYVYGIKWDNFFVDSQSRSDARGFDFMPRYQQARLTPQGGTFYSSDPLPRSGEQEQIEALWHREWKQAYRDYIGKKLRAFMPPLARKRAYWICALHHRLEEVKKERFKRKPRAWAIPPEVHP